MVSVLFIIESPFQCLCMLEAIDYFKVNSYDVLIPEKGIGLTNEQLRRLLKNEGIKFGTYDIKHAVYGLVPYFLHNHKHYDNIFVGNYYSPSLEAMAAFFGGWKYSLFFLDDGTQALSLFSNHPRYRFSNKKWEYVFKLFFAIGKIKRSKRQSFFTIFDVNSERFNIVKNDFVRLKAIRKKNQGGV